MILSLEDVSFTYSFKPILDHVNLVINEKEKWGIVGQNGVGKSTLLKIMTGLEKPDSGNVTILKKYKISYCPQNTDFKPHKTIYETVRSYMTEETEIYQIQAILNKLGLSDYNQSIDILSGGQKKRVALAISLIKEADVYVLDEPTNHLDQDMILWLEKFLAKVSKTVILVTHDRYFLTRITNHIMELDDSHLYTYVGGYADYLEQREIRRENALNTEKKRQNFLRTEIEWIRAGAQARSTKQKSRIERFEKISAIEAPREISTLELKSAATRLGNTTIELDHISKAFGDNVLFEDFSYNLLRMDRIGIIGKNGCGKSTLLKIILGQIQPDSGTVKIGETVKIGYFAQQNEVFDDNQRVIDYIKDFGERVYTADHEEITASQMLERFLFFKEEQYKPISKCSGGEKRRLYLCSILMSAPNILILDEPTNDLDTDTMTILEDYLDHFEGAVMAVSHDRYFLDKIADRLFVFDNHKISIVQKTYSDYLDELDKKKEPVSSPKEIKELKKNTNRLTYNEKKELASIEEEMPELETKIQELEEELNTLSDYAKIKEISDLLEANRNRLEEIENRWLELSEKDK